MPMYFVYVLLFTSSGAEQWDERLLHIDEILFCYPALGQHQFTVHRGKLLDISTSEVEFQATSTAETINNPTVMQSIKSND